MDTTSIPGAFGEAPFTDAVSISTITHEYGVCQATTLATLPNKDDAVLTHILTPTIIEASTDPHGKDARTKQDDGAEHDISGPRLRSSRTWKAKGAEMLNDKRERKRPLGLLDLPVDILKEIVSAVTHTNDLTSLARCHSALHRLAIPPLFSKFDIIWPMETSHAEPRSGVDALTYGLATLVMAEEIFGEAPLQKSGRATDAQIRRRRGNHYAQYTKKFSLGNGPADWVQEYLITKEGGKMLGTLVALALARMRSLETFIWDMPTGVLRDVWMALSSLGDRPNVECRLQKVWIRWHDNTPIEPSHPPAPYTTPHSPQQSSSHLPAQGQRRHVLPEDLDHVEHPNFSILPPLKSLSVLDIDELPYLDEMAVLIERSLAKLEELRVGIARHATTRDWLITEESDDLQQIDRENPTVGSLTIGGRRFGGVLGTLTGLVHDMKQPLRSTSSSPRISPRAPRASPSQPKQTLGFVSLSHNADARQADKSSSDTAAQCERIDLSVPRVDADLLYPTKQLGEGTVEEKEDESSRDTREMPQHRLSLQTLELERIPLSINVLLRAFDWSKLTCLTILHCQNHDELWRQLRQDFAPTPRSPILSGSRQSSTASPRRRSRAPDVEMIYPLQLKRIHINTVSPALVHFLKETLAPNTLEVLFLQEVRSYASSVTVEAIYKGPLRRHRMSLVKVLIDSSEKGPDGIPTSSSRWRRWMLTREILTFICSGKMPRLRELGMAIEYRDWHFFLQRLPSIPRLRSLYIPFLADHVHGADVDPRELALQIVDIVALRPEVELCYMGIANKCFEILEDKNSFDPRQESHLGHGDGAHFEASDPEDDVEDGGDDDDMAATVDNDDDHEEEEDDEHDNTDEENEQDDTESDSSSTDGDSDSAESSSQARLRLREILFYDDKVAIFRARHGRL